MSSSTKVESYLKRHKIGSLFEGMMGKLVKEMPADPLEYLTQLILDQKQKRKSPTGTSEMLEGKLGTSSAWASDTKEYEKPWRPHSKKIKPSSPEGRKEWDKTVKLTSKSFDELTLNKHVTRPSKAAGSFQKESNDIFNTTSTDVGDHSMSEEELLSVEMPVSVKVGKTTLTQSSQSTTALRHHPKQKGPKADAARHAQELKSFLQEKRTKKENIDSGVSSEQVSSDDEVNRGSSVLTEDIGDLADEGVKIPAGAGKQVKKSTHRKSTTDPLIHMSICSRCAKVVVDQGQDSDSSVTASTASTRASKRKSQGQNTSRSDQWATHRTDDKTSPQRNPTITTPKSSGKGGFQQLGSSRITGRADLPTSDRNVKHPDMPTTQRTGFSSFYGDDDDDEFESVSQISGNQPRIPMWTASDEEDLSPVKGANMLTSPRIAAKQAGRKTVTLREDMLKGLPRSTDTVRDFIGSNTWSGDKMATNRSMEDSRRSYDSFMASRKQQETRNPRQSHDPLTSKATAGWKFEAISDADDDSTVLYK